MPAAPLRRERLRFADVMNPLLAFLSGAAIEVDERWHAEAEASYELRQLADEFWRE